MRTTDERKETRRRLTRYVLANGRGCVADLAVRLDCQRSAIYQWLKGTRTPTGRLRRLLLEVLAGWESGASASAATHGSRRIPVDVGS